MGRRKAEKSADFSKIRDAEGRIVTFLVFLEISLCESTRGFESLSLRHKNDEWRLPLVVFISERDSNESVVNRRVPLSAFFQNIVAPFAFL